MDTTIKISSDKTLFASCPASLEDLLKSKSTLKGKHIHCQFSVYAYGSNRIVQELSDAGVTSIYSAETGYLKLNGIGVGAA